MRIIISTNELAAIVENSTSKRIGLKIIDSKTISIKYFLSIKITIAESSKSNFLLRYQGGLLVRSIIRLAHKKIPNLIEVDTGKSLAKVHYSRLLNSENNPIKGMILKNVFFSKKRSSR